MAYTIFDAGFLEWFDNRQTSVTITDFGGGGVVGSRVYALSQTTDNRYADITPYIAILFPNLVFFDYNPGSLGGITKTLWVKKTLPEPTSDGWFAQKLYYSHVYPSTASGYITFLALENESGEIASIRTSGPMQTNTGTAECYIGSTRIGMFALPQATVSLIEIRYRVSESNGIFQVWLNGAVVVEFTGNTGTVNVTRVAYYSGKNTNIAVSSFVYTNEGRIGNKLPVVSLLTGPGSVSDGAFENFIGNIAGGGTSGAYTATKTLSPVPTFPEAGTIKGFTIYLSAAGTYKVGVVSVNSSNPAKRTLRLVSDTLTAAAQGTVTLTAGIDFPDNWTVTTLDAIAICLLTATIGAATGVSDWAADGLTGAAYYLNADGLNSSDQTEKTYSSAASDYAYKFAAVYEATDKTRAYTITDTTKEMFPATFTNNNRYFKQTAEGQTNKFTVADLPVPCVSIRSVKITASAVGDDTLGAADFIVDAGGVETVTTQALPTNLSTTDVYVSGIWTAAQYNTAQIGIRSKSST